ncbi:glycosyltransferase family 2 protein [Salinimicrobium soli]|uniref:glycosyltransferase family 2 protein n=1 Tax=Salinimicrobium soli TaxID=1254399 RepID=UPI003AAECE72
MILILGIITVLYTGLLLFLLYGFHQLSTINSENEEVPKTGFSIIIPFRNEAENLPRLLQSLRKLNYPEEQFEIILVNDASEDTSEAICLNFKKENPELQIQLLQNEHNSASPKKDAITAALKRAKFDHIITTDADCVVPAEWLQLYNSEITRTKSDFVAGPVDLLRNNTNRFLQDFQQMDIFSLQIAGMGGFGANLPFMCNGANLCYSKKAFLEVNGFEGNTEIASGDDVFLLEKFRSKGFRTGFLKSKQAVVETNPQPDLRALISQRIRWAAKTSSYKNFFGKFTGLVVLLMNLGLVSAFFTMLMGSMKTDVFFLFFLVKFNVDFILIFSSARFFEQEDILKSYFWSSFLYPFFSSSVAILSLFSGYTWKGRRFKK